MGITRGIRVDLFDEFQDQASSIRQSWKAAYGMRATSPFASRSGTFKRESYRLIRRVISAPGGHNVIKHLVNLAKRDPGRLMYKGNEFHYGLLALDPWEEVLDAKSLSRLARQLTYADRHGISPDLLVGFLYQSGSTADISRKVRENEREPWFRR